jgi:cation-transporting ATPase E
VGLDPDGSLVGIDAATLPDDPEALAEAVDAGTVFGRVNPQQKRAMVKALQARGHIVAMTGDGVNDVLALKDADIGVAMGSGSAASRSAAQLVLLDQRFASLPEVVAEGRRAIANVERVANLFLTKTVYSMLLALAVGVLGLPFPFLPRHLTLVGALTIGIPAFFLALAPNDRRAEPHFVARVLRFAVPCGTLAAVATFSGYYLARVDGSLTLDQERTTATLVLVSIGLLILVTLAAPLNRSRRILVAAMLGGFLLVLALPAGRTYFALSLPPLPIVMAAVGVVALAALVMHGAARLVALYHAPFERLMAAQSNREQREADDRADRNEEGARQVTAPEPVTADAPTAVPAEPPTAVAPAPAADAADAATSPLPAEPPTAVAPTADAATAPLPADAAATTTLPDSPEPTTPLRPPDPEAHG